MMTPRSATLTAALAYAEHGWRVMPVALVIDGGCTCGWPAGRCSSPGKHPLNPGGCRNATTDPQQIAAWWRRWPNANVGIATGEASNLAVLDVDGEPGRVSLLELESDHGPLPGTVTAITSRGCHLLYKWAPGLGIGAGLYGEGLDHRGEGGYIIAPPSAHPSGSVYRWLTADESDSRPWAHPLPHWPAHALPVNKSRPVVVPLRPKDETPQPTEGVLAGLVRVVLEAPVGERNNRLNWAAYRAGEHVRAGRITQVAAVTALQLAAERIGLTVGESRGTIASGLISGAA
jgi:hypothetical protein